MIKRFVTTILISFVMCMSFLIGYRQVLSVPVYADSTSSVPDGYSPCGLNDQVDAFRSYCYSRNLAIEGSSLDTITTVTSSIYQHLVSMSGLDINELQNQIYKNTNTVGAKWFFTSTGIAAYNRLFAELLQNNDLAVGDQVNDVTAWEGERFVDDDGNSCLVYSFNSNTVSPGTSLNKDLIISYGTYLKYDSDTLNSMLSVDEFFNASFNISGRVYSGNKTSIDSSSNGLGWGKFIATVNNVQHTYIAIRDRYTAIYDSDSFLFLWHLCQVLVLG